MQNVELDPRNILAAEAKIPEGAPVTMINLVQLFEEAQYEDDPQKPCSGREA